MKKRRKIPVSNLKTFIVDGEVYKFFKKGGTWIAKVPDCKYRGKDMLITLDEFLECQEEVSAKSKNQGEYHDKS